MSEWIKEATADDFESLVVEASRQRPVIVDFWAPWCGPCKALTPVLEAAVEARAGQVALVKVNTDENQALAMRFNIRGIPAVKIFVDGGVVEEFVGAVDKHAIDLVLDRVIPSEAARTLKKARELLSSDQVDQIPALLDPLVNDPVHQDDALLLIAKAYAAQRDYERALETLATIDRGVAAYEEAEALRVRLLLIKSAGACPFEACRQAVESNPDDLEARWALAGHQLDGGNFAGALEELMAVLQRDRTFHDDGARRAMVAIFDALGSADSLTQEYRRRMQIYL